MKEKMHLTGTIWKFSDNIGNITADDGDWYDFRSKRKFREGERVSFDVVRSGRAFPMALLGGPIPCINVRRFSDGKKAQDLDSLKPGSKAVNIFIVSKSSESDS